MNLETHRLKLRPFVATDGDHLFALDNDPVVMRFINGGIATPYAVIENEILPLFITRNQAHPYFGFWLAEDKENGKFLGWFSFRLTEPQSGEVTLGYRLRQSAWGKGFATEGARVLMEKGFAEWGVKRVVATTYEENIGSQRVLEKLGMSLVDKIRMSAEDLANVDTSHVDAGDVWAGFDFVYALEKPDFI